jgi:hypothetical protein
MGSPAISSNEPEGKKWLVTKVVEVKGKPVCWSVPVEVKTGEMVRAALTEDNELDLGAAFASAVREAGSKK